MIPAVQDFTQKAWAQQQATLLQQQQQQQQHRQQQDAAVTPVAVGQAPAQAASAGLADGAAGSVGDDHLELLGKVLITPEQLREKIMVSFHNS